MVNARVENLLERLTIKKVLLIWFLTSIIFALIYHLFVLLNIASFNYTQSQISNNLKGFLNLVYSGLVTFTPTGLGALVPLGVGK